MDIKNFVKLNKKDQIKFLTNLNIDRLIPGDMFEINGVINDVDLLCNKNKEIFVMVNFKKGGVWNENALILYDDDFEPIGKMAFSYNKDGRVSFDYFFVNKNIRGQQLGQFMINYFLEYMEDIFDIEPEIYTNPYSFDTSFNGIKGYDYDSQLSQYRLEQFYIRNGFYLTEEPKKYVFGNEIYDPESYQYAEEPIKEDLNTLDYLNKHTYSFGYHEHYF